jgi:hypothetical protein
MAARYRIIIFKKVILHYVVFGFNNQYAFYASNLIFKDCLYSFLIEVVI